MKKLKKRLSEISRIKENKADFIFLKLEESILQNAYGGANSSCTNMRCGHAMPGKGDTNNSCTNHSCYDGDTNSSCTNNGC